MPAPYTHGALKSDKTSPPSDFNASEAKAFTSGVSDALAAKGTGGEFGHLSPQGFRASTVAHDEGGVRPRPQKAAAEAGPNKIKGAEFAGSFSKEKRR